MEQRGGVPAADAQPLVRFSIADGIATLTLDRPDQRNAINAAVAAGLLAAMDRFEADAGARVAVLTAAGDKAFCSGMDLKAFAAGEGPAIFGGRGGFAGFTRYPRTKPVIAAVNGAVLAGGCELVLACDLVVAADTAVFGQPEVKRGLFAAAGGAIRLPRTIPRVRAMELLLTGDPIDARTALELGLVNRVVPLAALPEAARDLARRICANAPLAVRETLAIARRAGEPGGGDLWELNDTAWERVAASEDASEGPRAFAEKRPARWQGR
jgi:enoyl-CoA hydratase/carnithine racemase